MGPDLDILVLQMASALQKGTQGGYSNCAFDSWITTSTRGKASGTLLKVKVTLATCLEIRHRVLEKR